MTTELYNKLESCQEINNNNSGQCVDLTTRGYDTKAEGDRAYDLVALSPGLSLPSLEVAKKVIFFPVPLPVSDSSRQVAPGSDALTRLDQLDQAVPYDDSLSLIPDKHLDKIKQCGKKFAVMWCPDCGTEYIIPLRCNSRFCPKCARIRSAVLVRKYQPYLDQVKHLYFLTLTIKNIPAITLAIVRKMILAFRRLRRSKEWKATFGIWALEVTNEGNGYHLHLHILINRWVDINAIRDIWTELTGGRWCYIEYVRKERRAKASSELIKYVTKLSELTDDKLSAIAKAFEGVRLINTFGAKKIKKFLQYNKQINIPARAEWWKTCKCGGKLVYKSEIEYAAIKEMSSWRDFMQICPVCRQHYLMFPHLKDGYDEHYENNGGHLCL